MSGLAAEGVRVDAVRGKASARLVLVDATELQWQRDRYREQAHLLVPADPLLVGLNTLQHWLWNRIGAPPGDEALTKA